jgi:predicted deacetylase/glycosyltransferase involved in cell wall biosynthesis
MDMIRWVSLGRALRGFGVEVDLVTDRPDGVGAIADVPVVASAAADWDAYDLVKVCYQPSLRIVPPHRSTLVRMCRVVDQVYPTRDDGHREELLRLQEETARRARWVAFNDATNEQRWCERYGYRQATVRTPTGCPDTIPEPGPNPYPPGPPVLLHCGSLTSPRLADAIERLAEATRRSGLAVRIAHLGRNRLHVYGAAGRVLDRRVIDLGEVDVDKTWSYIHHASVGIALAPSEHAFESELSKVYYYLRGGLPVVTEDSVANRHLVEQTAHGAIARYDDPASWIAAIEHALRLPAREPRVMQWMVERHGWARRARTYLDLLRAPAQPWGVVRIDDVHSLCPALLALWELLEQRSVPIHLEVIPALMTAEGARAIAGRARASRVCVTVHQHGYRHHNHGCAERKFEFGEGRDAAAQAREIATGAEKLEALFPGLFQRCFSAPWNRLDAATVQALAGNGFHAYSATRPARAEQADRAQDRVRWIPMTVDPVDWRPQPRCWDRARITNAIRESTASRRQVGIVLHAAVMDGPALRALADALDDIGEEIRWVTMRDAAALSGR